MKIVFFGDSITDMSHHNDQEIFSYGSGFLMYIAGELYREDPKKYRVINKGIGGNRVADLYSRVKTDVWYEQPDVVSILIGVNDVWQEVDIQNEKKLGTEAELARFKKVYGMLLEDTARVLPNAKLILCEPFVLPGTVTGERGSERFKSFEAVYAYAGAIKELADEYGAYFLPLQKQFDEAADQFGSEAYLYDGVHPMVAGARLIAEEWLKLFKGQVEKSIRG